MHKLFYLILLAGLVYSNKVSAQDKFEKESRMKRKDVPSKARMFIDSLNDNTKIKWYKEEGLTRKSIEAKFKRNKIKHSIEFDTLGIIEDVEIETDWKNVASHAADSISAQLSRDCSKYQIVKVQIQFSGSENELFSLLKTGVKSENLVMNYEIVVRCKQQKEVDLFEYLFNTKGLLLFKSKIVFKNSSHLEY